MAPHPTILLALGIGGLFLLAGCGHPTAASPLAGAANEEPTPEVISKVPQAAPAEEAQNPVPDAGASHHAAVAELPPAPAAPPAAGQRPPADRTPSRPGEAEKITWDDLNLGMQADVVFRPFMADPVKDLEGKRISIVGYMHGGQATQRGIKEFILLKNTQCKFGPGGQADHLANVVLKEGASTGFTPSPVKVEGTLKVEPYQGPDGNTWSIYRLEGAQIK